jgi:hypothetical protein
MAVDDGYTVVLMHFDGVDGSTDFVDESGKAWSNNNSDCEIDTAQKKYGQSSLLNGDVAKNGYITTADHADFSFGSDDWTLEYYTYITAVQVTGDGYAALIGASSNASDRTIGILVTSDSKLVFTLGHAGTTVYIYASDALSTGQWYHIAAVKYGSTVTMYVNGIVQGANATISGPLIEPTLITFGGGYSSSGLAAWYDELRISKGIARYTAAFTPPGAPFGPPSGEYMYFADGLSVY